MSRIEEDAGATPPRGAVSRLLQRAANALLSRSLPRIRASLERRLGRGAAIDAITLDGSLLRVERARVPVRGLGSVPIDDLALAIRLHGAAVRWRASARIDGASIEASGAIAMGAGRSGDLFEGWLRSPRLAPVRLGAITARFDGVGAISLERLIRRGGGSLGFTIPPDVRAAGELTIAEDGATTGALQITTPRSNLTLDPLHARGGRVDGTRLEGTLAFADALTIGLFPTDARPSARGVVRGELEVAGALPSGLTLKGRIESPLVQVVLESRPDLAPFIVHDVALDLGVSRERLTYEDLSATSSGGAFRGRGAIFFDRAADDGAWPRLHVRFEHTSADLVESLGRLSASSRIRVERPGERPAGELWIPRDAQLFGELTWAQDRSLSGDIGVETPRSSLLLQLALSPDLVLDGSTVRGRLAFADVLRCGLLDTPIRPAPEGAARVEAVIGGPLSRAVISGRAAASDLRLGRDGSAAGLTVRFDDVAVLFSVDPERVVWRNLQARVFGGTLQSSGLIGSGPAFNGLQATVAWSDLLVAELPAGPGANGLGDHVRGRLSGELRVDRRGPGPLTARGHAALADPDYRFLSRVEPALAPYELTIPSTRSAVPLRAQVQLSGDTIQLSELSAAIDGCSIEGAITIGLGGELRGLLHAHLQERFLGRSPILSIPAALTGDVVVPVALGGSLGRPAFDADFVGALERLVTRSAVGSAIRGAVGDFWSAISGEPAARRPIAMPEEDMDRIADRIIAGDRDSERLMRELVDAGVDAEEFARLVERRRRRRVRVRVK